MQEWVGLVGEGRSGWGWWERTGVGGAGGRGQEWVGLVGVGWASEEGLEQWEGRSGRGWWERAETQQSGVVRCGIMGPGSVPSCMQYSILAS